MNNSTRHILQVSTSDIGGGAEKVAWNLFRYSKLHGYDSWLVVGNKHSENANVILMKNDKYRNIVARLGIASGNIISPLVGKIPGARYLLYGLYRIGQIRRFMEIQQGHEDFDFPATKRILDLIKEQPEIIHCHNLHGDYFDLRMLPWLSHQVPVILTLHDAWLLSGHCAHSFDCERWKTGCGNCPHLTIYPRVKRDATAFNFKRKQEIYSKSSLYIVTPSQWLMKKVEQSILVPAIVEAKVIPNGVDISIFHPGNKQEIRNKLGISQSAKMLLFAANGIQNNIWKDYKTLTLAVSKVAERMKGHEILFIAMGQEASPERIGQAEINFVPFLKDPEAVSNYYQAADIYIHASRAEVWGLTITEALACGIPVVATAVGGIPEQIEDGVTGFLTPPEDAETMATRIIELLNNDKLRLRIGEQAADVARKKFDLDSQVKKYFELYELIKKDWSNKS